MYLLRILNNAFAISVEIGLVVAVAWLGYAWPLGLAVVTVLVSLGLGVCFASISEEGAFGGMVARALESSGLTVVSSAERALELRFSWQNRRVFEAIPGPEPRTWKVRPRSPGRPVPPGRADDFHRERRDNITYSSGPAQAALSTVTEFYFSDRRPM